MKMNICYNCDHHWSHVSKEKLTGKQSFTQFAKENLPEEYWITSDIKDWNIFGKDITEKYKNVGVPYGLSTRDSNIWVAQQEAVEKLLTFITKEVFVNISKDNQRTQDIRFKIFENLLKKPCETIGTPKYPITLDKVLVEEIWNNTKACFHSRKSVYDLYYFKIIEELPFY